MKTKYNLLRMACSALAISSIATAQSLVFSENFGTMADGTAVDNTNTGFNYRTTLTYGAMNITNPDGDDAALRIESIHAGNVITGIAVKGLPSSSVYTVAFSLKLAQLPGGTSFRFAMGESGGSMYPAQGTNPGRIDNDTNYETWANQSLFVVNLGGNNNVGSDFGLFGSLQTNKSHIQFDQEEKLLPDTLYNISIIANGSGDAINLDGNTIGVGEVALYIDGTFINSVVMANSVAADTFAIYSHGRSANGDFAEGTIDNIQIWNGVTPIPEPASAAILLGFVSLTSIVILRRKC